MLEESAAPKKPTGLSGLCRNRISSGISPSGPRSITCVSKGDSRQLPVFAEVWANVADSSSDANAQACLFVLAGLPRPDMQTTAILVALQCGPHHTGISAMSVPEWTSEIHGHPECMLSRLHAMRTTIEGSKPCLKAFGLPNSLEMTTSNRG